MVEKRTYIEKLKQVHLAKTGVMLDDATALALFERLVSLVRSIYKPLPLTPKTHVDK